MEDVILGSLITPRNMGQLDVVFMWFMWFTSTFLFLTLKTGLVEILKSYLEFKCYFSGYCYMNSGQLWHYWTILTRVHGLSIGLWHYSQVCPDLMICFGKLWVKILLCGAVEPQRSEKLGDYGPCRDKWDHLRPFFPQSRQPRCSITGKLPFSYLQKSLR